MAEKIFTVDKFLGLNEAADGTSELKLGEASKMENFYVTDDYNLKTRPGIRRYIDPAGVDHLQAWTFFSGKYEYLATVRSDSEGRQILEIYRAGELIHTEEAAVFWSAFPYGGKICILFADKPASEGGTPQDVNVMFFEAASDGSIALAARETPYAPLVFSGCVPSGGGTQIERRNLLTRSYYVEYVGDGNAKKYVLTSDVAQISFVSVDGETADFGNYDDQTHTFTFTTAPRENAQVRFRCETLDADLLAACDRLLRMPYTELFNGATDTRVFFYGDGSNICYYSGIPLDGSGFYVPEGNELSVDFSNSPITGMVRHYSRLLAYKPDGVDAITYEPITLADGSVIAGFYLHPVNRDYGNDALGQVALVNNHPRTFSCGSIYEWRISSSNYRDERYAKCVSQKISETLNSADPEKLVACDDGLAKTYYVFLNDESGTVLVNRYDIEVWNIYRSALARDVRKVVTFEGKVVFLRSDGLYCFDPDYSFDDIADEDGRPTAIACLWESGYMAFGADYKRKYSSNVWVSMLPEYGSHMDVTVRTDRRGEYLTKSHGLPLFDFAHVDFSSFSFITSKAPKIKRIKIKVKKFVYYKLILRVTKRGARATVLGYDQQVRYSSNVK